MGCEVLPWKSAGDQYVVFAPVPDVLRLRQVRLAHSTENKMELSLDFFHGPPPLPRTVISGGQVGNAPGSITYHVLIAPPRIDDFGIPTLQISSPSGGDSWSADATSLDDPNRNTLLSAYTMDNTVKLFIDLEGQDSLLGNGPFTPTVTLTGYGESGNALTMVNFEAQQCNWNT